MIYFASDHAGFELKNQLLAYVRDELGYAVMDCGAYVYDAEDDFTDFIAKAAREVSASPEEHRAIILGGSGQGEAMLANRFHGVRAVVYYGGNEEIITLSRQHNDANILSLGARFLETTDAQKVVALWLRTPHESVSKYERRIEEIEAYSAAAKPPRLTLVPSLPAKSFDELAELFSAMEGTAKGVQVDIVDGVFAPHVSWPFTEPDVPKALEQLRQFTTVFDVEVDCMCMDPLQYLDILVQAGVSRVVIHMGSTESLEACIAHAHTHGYTIGLALTNDVPLERLQGLVDSVDFIQVMGIRQVGAQGQDFDERTLTTVAKLRKVHPYLEIAVDGAVNERTIPQLFAAGVNRFAPGSAITRAEDKVAAYNHLSSLLR